MMSKLVKLAWLAVILIAVPTMLPAQTSSVDTPNNIAECGGADPNAAVDNVPAAAGAGRKMSFRIRPASGPNVNVNNVPLAPCDDGNVIARRLMDAALVAATAQGYGCTAVAGGCNAAVPGPCGCAEFPPVGLGPGSEQNWNFRVPGQSCGFKLRKALGAATSDIDLEADDLLGLCIPQAQNVSTNAGNSIDTDLLPWYRFQVVPNGQPGSATLAITHSQGGQNPRTVLVDTTGKSVGQIMAEFQTGIAATGLGLTTALRKNLSASVPDGFSTSGPILVIYNAQARQVQKFSLTAPPGMDSNQENAGSTPGVPVPALSPWGVTILVAVLLLTSVWMLRRRVRNSEI